MSTTATAQPPSRKQSFLRHKIRDSFRPLALRGLLDHAEKDGSKQSTGDVKRSSVDEGSWIARKRRKNKQSRDEPQHVIGEIKIDLGDFEDLRATLDNGSEMYSMKSPQTIATFTTMATTETNAMVVPPEKPLMQKLNQRGAVVDPKEAIPQPMELEDTSGVVTKTDNAMDIDPPVQEPKFQVQKGPKWQIKTDTLVRPVSSGRANALSANVSQTIAAINKNNFQANGKWSSTVDSMASARPSIESSRSKVTSYTSGTDKVDSVIGSNASITTTHGATRRPLGDTTRSNHTATTRHSVGDMDKLLNAQSSTPDQENKRSSFPPVAVRRQSLVNMHSAQQRPRSPTGSIASTASAVPRTRRPSGTNVSSRLSWIQNLENGGQNPGQEYMLKKLEGGVADKLRRFESQSSQESGSSSRSQSVTRSSDAYGIEGKRLSRTTTADGDFRKKLEEQFQKKKQEDEEREKKKVALRASKTPQQIIDYAELNDRDREAAINDLMKDGKGPENAKALDRQATAALKTQPRSVPQQASSVFLNASAGLKSTTNLLDMPATGQGRINGFTQSTQKAQSTTSLQRTMSVQQRPKQAASIRPARPVSYAAVTAPIDDDYDPFNYSSYPSRSSMYSNPPEAPAMTPGDEVLEEEAMPVIDTVEVEAAPEPAPAPTPTPANVVEEVVVPEASVPVVAEKSSKEIEVAQEAPKEVASSSAVMESAETPKKPSPAPAASGWASRFQAREAPQKVESTSKNAETKPVAPEPPVVVKLGDSKPETSLSVTNKSKHDVKEEAHPISSASKIPLRGGAQKPAAVIASAAAAAAAATTHEVTEALVAREAVPASPTLVDVVKSKKPAADADVPSPTSTLGDQPKPEQVGGRLEVESREGSLALPKSSLPVRRSSASARPSTPQKQTPASLLLANGSVKIASPCSSPKSPKEFNAAALPRLGTA